MTLRDRAESLQSKVHDGLIAGKRFTSMAHYSLVHKFIPMPQVMKIPDAKAAVDKEWKKLETIPAWDLRKVKSKNGSCSGSTKRQHQSPLCFIDGHTPPQECRGRTKIEEVERDVVKADSGACAVFTEQSSSASQMTAAKNHGCYCKITRLWWTSSWCNISVHPSKIHKSECPDVWIRFPRHKNGQNHERKLKNPWFLLTEICTVVH